MVRVVIQCQRVHATRIRKVKVVIKYQKKKAAKTKIQTVREAIECH